MLMVCSRFDSQDSDKCWLLSIQRTLSAAAAAAVTQRQYAFSTHPGSHHTGTYHHQPLYIVMQT